MNFKQFLLFGPPGIGVEEHAIALAQRWRLPYVSMAKLVQAELDTGPILAAEVSPYVDAGEPLPDELAMKLIRRRFEQPDAMLKGWVVAGFPQTLTQAEAFEKLSATFGRPPATVIYLKAMTGLLTNRLWMAQGQQEPVVAIRQRLTTYLESIAPLLDYYRQRSQLKTINGSLPFAEVAHELAQLGQEAAGAAPLIKDEAELDSLLAREAQLVVDCMAAWCGSCQQVTPAINQLAQTYGDRVAVRKIDFDANRNITKRFELQGIPAVMFFKNGERLETLTGVKSYSEYNAAVHRLLGQQTPQDLQISPSEVNAKG